MNIKKIFNKIFGEMKVINFKSGYRTVLDKRRIRELEKYFGKQNIIEFNNEIYILE